MIRVDIVILVICLGADSPRYDRNVFKISNTGETPGR